MKKVFSLILVFVTTLALTACATQADSAQYLSQEGIAPYAISESEQYLLQSLGLEDNTQLISFKAPPEAVNLSVSVYQLTGEDWAMIGGGGIHLDADRQPGEQLVGTFTMTLLDDYALDFHINSQGTLAAYRTEPIPPTSEIIASSKGFLEDFQAIEINQEIPVALMVYDSGTRMQSFSLQDYFQPANFTEMDLVQAVTLTFTDQ